MDLENEFYLLVSMILIGILFGLFMGWVFVTYAGEYNVHLNDETSNKICQDLATYSGMNYSNETISGITAKSKKGELICILPEEPSYDHTTLIKFERNKNDN